VTLPESDTNGLTEAELEQQEASYLPDRHLMQVVINPATGTAVIPVVGASAVPVVGTSVVAPVATQVVVQNVNIG